MRYLTGDECRDNNIIFGHNQNQEFEREKHQNLAFGNKKCARARRSNHQSDRPIRRLSVSYHVNGALLSGRGEHRKYEEADQQCRGEKGRLQSIDGDVVN